MIKFIASVRHAIAEWVEFFRAIPHFTIVTARQEAGRLFYFRDRPHWFVNGMAEQPLETDDARRSKDTWNALVLEARAERQRRIEQAIREVAAINPVLAEFMAQQEHAQISGGNAK